MGSTSGVRATNVECGSYTLELFGLPCPPPTLQIASEAAPDKVRLQWSMAYPGYRLQTSAALHQAGANAFNTGDEIPVVVRGRYKITNSTTPARQFHRLVK